MRRASSQATAALCTQDCVGFTLLFLATWALGHPSAATCQQAGTNAHKVPPADAWQLRPDHSLTQAADLGQQALCPQAFFSFNSFHTLHHHHQLAVTANSSTSGAPQHCMGHMAG